uniref:Uncharacterized protein n=1 Tax=Aureoumbra lagunensis TaxID=44058 RepID=A0A7S3K3Z3_9STRA
MTQEIGKKEALESAYRRNEPEEVRILSARSGIWIQDQLREKMQEHIFTITKSRLGEEKAKTLAAKIDKSWCESMCTSGRVSENYFSRAQAVMNAFKLLSPPEHETNNIPKESVEQRAQRIAVGKPALYMAWPDWAAKPWSRTDPRRKRGDEENGNALNDDLQGQARKWRRLDERAIKPNLFYGIAVTPQEIQAAEASAVAVNAARQSNTSHPQQIDENDDVLGEIEQLLAEEKQYIDETTTDDHLKSFVEEAIQFRAPTFFAGGHSRRYHSQSENDDELFALVKPTNAESYFHGRIKCYSARGNNHVIQISRAVAVLNGRIHIMYDCLIRLPYYFGDEIIQSKQSHIFSQRLSSIAAKGKENSARTVIAKLIDLSFNQVAATILKCDTSSSSTQLDAQRHTTTDAIKEALLNSYSSDEDDDQEEEGKSNNIASMNDDENQNYHQSVRPQVNDLAWDLDETDEF